MSKIQTQPWMIERAYRVQVVDKTTTPVVGGQGRTAEEVMQGNDAFLAVVFLLLPAFAIVAGVAYGIAKIWYSFN